MKLNKDEILTFAAGIVVGALAGAAVYFGFNFDIGRLYDLYTSISAFVTVVLYLAIPPVAIIWLLYQTYKKNKKWFWVLAIFTLLLAIGTICELMNHSHSTGWMIYVAVHAIILILLGLFLLYKLYKKSKKWFTVVVFLALSIAGMVHKIILYATEPTVYSGSHTSDYGLS